MAVKLNGQGFDLKYLFTAEYLDGTTFKQSPEDISSTDPKRSAYFDVKQDDLKRFWLEGNGHNYLVDLRDGHFEIDGLAFHPYDVLPAPPECRLIFFRQHTHQFNTEYEQLGHQVRYFIGWQATIGGKNFKYIIGTD